MLYHYLLSRVEQIRRIHFDGVDNFHSVLFLIWHCIWLMPVYFLYDLLYLTLAGLLD